MTIHKKDDYDKFQTGETIWVALEDKGREFDPSGFVYAYWRTVPFKICGIQNAPDRVLECIYLGDESISATLDKSDKIFRTQKEARAYILKTLGMRDDQREGPKPDQSWFHPYNQEELKEALEKGLQELVRVIRDSVDSEEEDD